MDTKNFLTEIFNFLNNNAEYAVLRNYEDLPEHPTRDIDIIITRQSFNRIRKSFVRIFTKDGYKLFQYYKGSEMHSLVFGKIQGIKCSFISFDFLFSIYARNTVFYNAIEVLATKIFNGKLYHVRRDEEFLAKFIYNTYLGQAYPSKYLNIKQEAISKFKQDIDSRLNNIGWEKLEELEAGLTKKHGNLRVRGIFNRLTDITRYHYATISNLFASQGIAIGFTGPDGAGKTTVIENMINKLNKIYNNIPLHHFRPQLIGNLGDVAHSAGLKKEVDHNFDKPHRGNKTSTPNSIARLSYYSIDYIIGYWIKIKTQLFKRNIIVFDRYYTDIECDSRRSRIYLPLWFLHGFGKLFIPKLDYNILLTARTETILNRKRELDREGIEAINNKIDYLAPRKGYYKILNEGTPEEAVAKILTIIFEEQHRKNMKRM